MIIYEVKDECVNGQDQAAARRRSGERAYLSGCDNGLVRSPVQHIRGGVQEMDQLTRNVMMAMLCAQRYPWEQGTAAQALYEAGESSAWLQMAYDSVTRSLPDGRLAMLGSREAVADPASAGEVCLRAYQKTGQQRFLKAAQGMLDYLMHKAPRTDDGLICHNTVSYHEGCTPYQLWVDAIYMMPPFLAVMGEADEAIRQINGYIRHLFCEDSGLFFHIYDAAEAKFIRRVPWATGNGWALLGMTRTAEELRKQSRPKDADALFCRILTVTEAMALLETEDGCFHDILDDPSAFTDHTSALMFAASVYRNILNGVLPPAFRAYADRAVLGAAKDIDAFGILHSVCGCPDFVRPGTSVEAQAAYIMARAWQEKAE